MIRFITSTRIHTLEEFMATTLLGQSFQRLARFSAMEIKVGLDAKDGLATVFNPEIEQASPEDILVFIHDDVWIDDWLIEFRLKEALASFDVIGIAGNPFRAPKQRGWYGTMDALGEEFKALGEPRYAIGRINDTPTCSSNISPIEVKLLDGVFIAVKASTFHASGIRFDPQFLYHHYDLDLSRQCEQAGLKMGIWPIALTHAQTIGDLGSAWFDSGTAYLKKWSD
ncbi:hypothetical protein DTO96_102045 [Ephemeroptericola cinctiostellae]|uniref:Glycosyltransferase 2-like domain-containing protein n=1 Tax=Ephemeroptericola cinctiostellae TaxID=2268024 RepID=A0A345DD61_9BURK|nr:glycosyltransferase [Ephemeroptericola cinctiostellae]AXF86299.1 hypothetical protein DTO96_102045 [Ephemeroptericola cinctiostellae]